MHRGRKSSESQSVVVSLVPGVRPDPPAELSPEQAETWRAAVNSMPADWFAGCTGVLLRQLCRHVSYSRWMAEELAAVGLGSSKKACGLDRFDKLSRMHLREGKAISSLMTKLRLTPQSKYSARAATRQRKALRASSLGNPTEAARERWVLAGFNLLVAGFGPPSYEGSWGAVLRQMPGRLSKN